MENPSHFFWGGNGSFVKDIYCSRSKLEFHLSHEQLTTCKSFTAVCSLRVVNESESEMPDRVFWSEAEPSPGE